MTHFLSKRKTLIPLAIGACWILALGFQNCAQPYDVQVAPYSEATIASSDALELDTLPITNSANVKLKLDKAYAHEMLIARSENCTGSTWVPYATSFSMSVGPEDGVYPISAKFRNSKLIETTCVATSVMLDTTAPVIMFTTQPASIVASKTIDIVPVVSDTLSGVDKVQCLLGEEQIDCEKKSVGPLSDGTFSYKVLAVDKAGNQAAPAIVTWLVDTTAPSLKIDSQPLAFTQATTATIAFTGADAGSQVGGFTCSLDNAAAVECTSPVMYSNLAEGTHAFTVTVKDVAGNTVSKSIGWFVDHTAPVVALVQGPPAIGNIPNVKITFTAADQTAGSGIAAITCSLDGAVPANCVSPVNIKVADGNHTFQVIGTDKAQNSGQLNLTFTVDTAPPTITLLSQPPAIGNNANVQFTFNTADVGTGLATVTCALDQAVATNCGGSFGASVASGPHSVVITATDRAANQSTKKIDFLVDTTPAVVTLVAPPDPNVYIPSSNVTFNYKITTDFAGIVATTCQIDANAPVNCAQTAYNAANLVDGNHNFILRVTDAAGNLTTVSAQFKTDATPPLTPLFSPPPPATVKTNGAGTTATAVFYFNVSDATSGIASNTCQLIGTSLPAAPCNSGIVYPGLAVGNYTFKVFSTDRAGKNSAAATAAFSVANPAVP